MVNELLVWLLGLCSLKGWIFVTRNRKLSKMAVKANHVGAQNFNVALQSNDLIASTSTALTSKLHLVQLSNHGSTMIQPGFNPLGHSRDVFMQALHFSGAKLKVGSGLETRLKRPTSSDRYSRPSITQVSPIPQSRLHYHLMLSVSLHPS